MIGSARRDEAIATLQAEGEASRARLAALVAQLAALAARVEAGIEQQAVAASERAALNTKLESRMDRMEAHVARLETAMGARLDAQAAAARGHAAAVMALEGSCGRQAAALSALEEADERHTETFRQIRADIVRLGLQAASDLGEMRAADAALAELLVRSSGRHSKGRGSPSPESI